MKKINILFILFLIAGINLASAQIPAPTNLTAEFKPAAHPGTNLYGFVELKWDMSTTPGVTYAYHVFRMDPGDTTYKRIASFIRENRFFDYNIRPQNSYSYYVIAANNQGVSQPSNIATVTTPPLPDLIRFVTIPPYIATIGQLYSYDADAVSNRPNAIVTYSLVNGPEGLVIDNTTGLVTWTPTNSGFFRVKIKAESNLGGFAIQEWTIKVIGPTGTITGVVKNEINNSPLAGVTVFFINTNSTRHEIAITNQQGQFTKQLVEGAYKIKFYLRGFLPEFYDNKPTLELADVVNVAQNSNINIDAALSPIPLPTLYNITGSVLNTNGLPVPSIVTAFIVRDTTFPIHLPNLFPRTMSAHTDSFGNYQLRVPGGFEYIIHARPLSRDYYPEFWDNKPTFQEADKILVNNNVSNINFILERKPVYNNGIAGLVKDYNTNNPVPAIISVFRLDNGRFKPVKTTRTDSLGNYLIENLIPGNYIVFARPGLPYLPGYYKADTVALRWKDADTVVVDANGIVSNININLIVKPDTGFARISGSVKTISGEPVNGANILVYNLNGQVVAYATTSNNGQYEVENIVAGDYTLIVDATDYENVNINNIVSLNYSTNPSAQKDLLVSPAGTTSVNQGSNIPTGYSLLQNYPNPFNPVTQIKFTIPEKSYVKLSVYNLIGQKVADLINSELNAGEYTVTFNANGLSSGVYIYRLESGNFVSTKKMILMK